MGDYCVGIIVAAGKGTRLGGNNPKQFMQLGEYPILYYSIKAMEESFIDEIIVVTGHDSQEYVLDEIIRKYGFTKVSKVVGGGDSRYKSVYNGLKSIKGAKYVFIHDAARPNVTSDIMKRALEDVRIHRACVVGIPVIDTVKVSDESGFIVSTPNRNRTWNIQTPQVFDYKWIMEAYDWLLGNEEALLEEGIVITDDAMILELYSKDSKIKLTMGNRENFKITEEIDLKLAELTKKR